MRHVVPPVRPLPVIPAFTLVTLASFLVAASVACGPSTKQIDPDPDGSTLPLADSGPLPENTAIFAHSDVELFRIDPETLEQTSVGEFTFEGEDDRITDIAINKDNLMIAISLESVYAVNFRTAETTLLSTFAQDQGGLTSLSYVLQDRNDPDTEKLVAADFDGNVWEIAAASGARVFLGNYNGAQGENGPLGSSGDIVSIKSFGTVATVIVEGDDTDHLAWIDPVTWEAELIGDTNRDKIFGIGFWRNKIYGFTDNMEFVTLSQSDGSASDERTGDIRWWGAGVTTLAPVID